MSSASGGTKWKCQHSCLREEDFAFKFCCRCGQERVETTTPLTRVAIQNAVIKSLNGNANTVLEKKILHSSSVFNVVKNELRPQLPWRVAIQNAVIKSLQAANIVVHAPLVKHLSFQTLKKHPGVFLLQFKIWMCTLVEVARLDMVIRVLFVMARLGGFHKRNWQQLGHSNWHCCFTSNPSLFFPNFIYKYKTITSSITSLVLHYIIDITSLQCAYFYNGWVLGESWGEKRC